MDRKPGRPLLDAKQCTLCRTLRSAFWPKHPESGSSAFGAVADFYPPRREGQLCADVGHLSTLCDRPKADVAAATRGVAAG